MSTAEWISLLSSVGTLLAALIALFTLLELFKQRKSSYKPDLTILQSYFDLKCSDTGGPGAILNWIKLGDQAPARYLDANLPIVNIGFGAAKNISARWSFDKESLFREVNSLAQKNHQPFYIEKDGVMLSVKSKEHFTYMVNDEMNSDEFEYLLPLSQDNSGREIALPPSYTTLVSMYLSLSAMKKIEFSEYKIPTLNLELNYSDIGKGKHRSVHKIVCHLSFIAQQDGQENSEFRVSLFESP